MGRNENRGKIFFTWMRNGVAFCFTWLVMLLLLRNSFLGVEVISTTSLLKILAFVFGGVLLFTVSFSESVFRKIGFTGRLTVFMILFSIYESVCFYWIGVFTTKGSLRQWLTFGGIILFLYGISMIVYEIYSRKKAVAYTHILNNYQRKRGKENDTGA